MRPAQGWCSDRLVQGWFPDYCSGLHAATAQNEVQCGMTLVLRPKECEGGATTKFHGMHLVSLLEMVGSSNGYFLRWSRWVELGLGIPANFETEQLRMFSFCPRVTFDLFLSLLEAK
ncbi:hypothetical protein HanHA300_Chr13g0481221 [Helianthus annuus]|nr:hypothetical protein HanHA300_Chr13g0481221 [Helianthus annuus]